MASKIAEQIERQIVEQVRECARERLNAVTNRRRAQLDSAFEDAWAAARSEMEMEDRARLAFLKSLLEEANRYEGNDGADN